MEHISADGAWRWDGRQWVPSLVPSTTAQPYGYIAPLPVDERRRDIDAASWSHYGPLMVWAAATLLTMTFVGAVLSWAVIFTFVIPLVIRQGRGRVSPFVAAHATESLNFQLTWLLAAFILGIVGALVAVATFGLGLILVIPAMLALAVFEIVVMILAGSAARRGEYYRYPLTLRFV